MKTGYFDTICMKVLCKRLRTSTQAIAVPLQESLRSGRRRRRRPRMRMDVGAKEEDGDQEASKNVRVAERV